MHFLSLYLYNVYLFIYTQALKTRWRPRAFEILGRICRNLYAIAWFECKACYGAWELGGGAPSAWCLGGGVPSAWCTLFACSCDWQAVYWNIPMKICQHMYITIYFKCVIWLLAGREHETVELLCLAARSRFLLQSVFLLKDLESVWGDSFRSWLRSSRWCTCCGSWAKWMWEDNFVNHHCHARQCRRPR